MSNDAHDIRIIPTLLKGFDSGRRRFRVACLTCRVIVHEATTGPQSMARSHREGSTPYGKPMPDDACYPPREDL